jgi:hypothetical protein
MDSEPVIELKLFSLMNPIALLKLMDLGTRRYFLLALGYKTLMGGATEIVFAARLIAMKGKEGNG